MCDYDRSHIPLEQKLAEYRRHYHFTPPFLKQRMEQAGFAIKQIDTAELPEDRVFGGRNAIVAAVRRITAAVASRMKLPYEMTVLAETAGR